MGMLMHRHRVAQIKAEAEAQAKAEAKPRRRRNRKAKPEQSEQPASPYAELTDEQVAEAYATNVAGEAEGREAQQAELEALDAENGEPDNG